MIQAVISYLYATTALLLLPESPRWLALCGKKVESLQMWERLELKDEEIEKGDDDAVHQVQWKDLLEVFGKDCWKQTALGVFLMAMQQASGIDGVLYVGSPSFFLSDTF
jgi:hypothetical protein